MNENGLVLGLKEPVPDLPEISIYPNPITDQHFWLEVSGPFRPSRVAEVYDLTGRLIFANLMKDSRERISFQGESQGLFIIKVIEENGVLLGAKKVRL